MTRDQAAREWALKAYRDALSSVLGFIHLRLEWRWDNAHLLALRARRMAYLLQTDPGRVALRGLRVRWWRANERRHAARAWAQNAVEAHACGLEC